MSTSRVLIASVLATMLVALPAWAHGLLVKVRGDGAVVTGTVYYSDGRPGAGEWVQMVDLTRPGVAPVAAATGVDGGFRFTGTVGHRYRIVVSGEEGHSVQSEITLGGRARGAFIDTDAPAPAPSGIPVPPAWVLIGGALALSVIPALWLRRRRKSSTPPHAADA